MAAANPTLDSTMDTTPELGAPNVLIRANEMFINTVAAARNSFKQVRLAVTERFTSQKNTLEAFNANVEDAMPGLSKNEIAVAWHSLTDVLNGEAAEALGVDISRYNTDPKVRAQVARILSEKAPDFYQANTYKVNTLLAYLSNAASLGATDEAVTALNALSVEDTMLGDPDVAERVVEAVEYQGDETASANYEKVELTDWQMIKGAVNFASRGAQAGVVHLYRSVRRSPELFKAVIFDVVENNILTNAARAVAERDTGAGKVLEAVNQVLVKGVVGGILTPLRLTNFVTGQVAKKLGISTSVIEEQLDKLGINFGAVFRKLGGRSMTLAIERTLSSIFAGGMASGDYTINKLMQAIETGDLSIDQLARFAELYKLGASDEALMHVFKQINNGTLDEKALDTMVAEQIANLVTFDDSNDPSTLVVGGSTLSSMLRLVPQALGADLTGEAMQALITQVSQDPEVIAAVQSGEDWEAILQTKLKGQIQTSAEIATQVPRKMVAAMAGGFARGTETIANGFINKVLLSQLEEQLAADPENELLAARYERLQEVAATLDSEGPRALSFKDMKFLLENTSGLYQSGVGNNFKGELGTQFARFFGSLSDARTLGSAVETVMNVANLIVVAPQLFALQGLQALDALKIGIDPSTYQTLLQIYGQMMTLSISYSTLTKQLPALVNEMAMSGTVPVKGRSIVIDQSHLEDLPDDLKNLIPTNVKFSGRGSLYAEILRAATQSKDEPLTDE